MPIDANPFYFHALRYLTLWLGVEQQIHQDVSGRDPSLEGLKRAMGHFRIARSFKGIADSKNRAFVLDHVLKAGNDGPASVELLTVRLQKKFKKLNQSAASKLLWMRHPKPFLIYDRNARVALRSLGAASFDDYAAFEVEWRRQFRRVSEDVKVACIALPNLQPWVAPQVDARQLQALSNESWFRERVFDNYLWTEGGRILSQKRSN